MLIQWIELYYCIGQGRDIIKEFQEERRYRYGGRPRRTALDDLRSQSRKEEEEERRKAEHEADKGSSSESVSLSDQESDENDSVSQVLPPRTGNFDADIAPSPKVTKFKPGQRKKSTNRMPEPSPLLFVSENSTKASSDVHIPPSGVPRESNVLSDSSVPSINEQLSSGALFG